MSNDAIYLSLMALGMCVASYALGRMHSASKAQKQEQTLLQVKDDLVAVLRQLGGV